MLPTVNGDFVFLETIINHVITKLNPKSLSIPHCLLCVDKKAGYSDRHNNGSGKSRKYSFSNDATSCGLVSESNDVSEPLSSSSRN